MVLAFLGTYILFGERGVTDVVSLFVCLRLVDTKSRLLYPFPF